MDVSMSNLSWIKFSHISGIWNLISLLKPFDSHKCYIQSIIYSIYSASNQSFSIFRMTPNIEISLTEFSYEMGFPFKNNPKNLDLSFKTDLDFWDCFGKEKPVL